MNSNHLAVSRRKLLATAALFSTGGVGIKSVHMTGPQVACLRSAFATLALLLLIPAARRNWNRRILLVAIAYSITLSSFVLANKPDHRRERHLHSGHRPDLHRLPECRVPARTPQPRRFSPDDSARDRTRVLLRRRPAPARDRLQPSARKPGGVRRRGFVVIRDRRLSLARTRSAGGRSATSRRPRQPARLPILPTLRVADSLRARHRLGAAHLPRSFSRSDSLTCS